MILKVLSLFSFSQTLSGYLIDVFRIVQAELKFNYTLMRSPDGIYVTQNKRNEWNGQIGLLEKNELDFSIMDLTVLLERSKV